MRIIATDWVGLSAFVASLAALATVLFNGYMAVKTHRKVESIDQAVNTRPPGSQSISQQVQDLADRLAHDVAKEAENDPPV